MIFLINLISLHLTSGYFDFDQNYGNCKEQTLNYSDLLSSVLSDRALPSPIIIESNVAGSNQHLIIESSPLVKLSNPKYNAEIPTKTTPDIAIISTFLCCISNEPLLNIILPAIAFHINHSRYQYKIDIKPANASQKIYIIIPFGLSI